VSVVAAPARRSLSQWLSWQETLHPRAIDMGLQRVRDVAHRLELLPFPAYCITVAGTNGKGSCAHMLGHLLSYEQPNHPGLKPKVGVYTSPYLLRYNERIRINGEDASDADLCTAFAAIEAARGEISLTYFEFGTLAALWLFKRAQVDYCVLEVGMGGRLDAVNIIDAEAALITSIGLDHIDWLGDNRESIGREKAGVFRTDQVAICAEREPPKSVLESAEKLQLQLRCIGKDFDLATDSNAWIWQDWQDQNMQLTVCPNLLPDNVAGVLALLTAIGRLPNVEVLVERLAGFSVPGRRQVIEGEVPVVLDVAHNLEAVQTLSHWLQEHPITGSEHIVIAMLKNKPVEQIGGTLASLGQIYPAGLTHVDRGLPANELQQRLNSSGPAYETVDLALQAAKNNAKAGDRIVVCGSFYTVAAVLADQARN